MIWVSVILKFETCQCNSFTNYNIILFFFFVIHIHNIQGQGVIGIPEKLTLSGMVGHHMTYVPP